MEHSYSLHVGCEAAHNVKATSKDKRSEACLSDPFPPNLLTPYLAMNISGLLHHSSSFLIQSISTILTDTCLKRSINEKLKRKFNNFSL